MLTCLVLTQPLHVCRVATGLSAALHASTGYSDIVIPYDSIPFNNKVVAVRVESLYNLACAQLSKADRARLGPSYKGYIRKILGSQDVGTHRKDGRLCYKKQVGPWYIHRATCIALSYCHQCHMPADTVAG